jgi:hypothetical protein
VPTRPVDATDQTRADDVPLEIPVVPPVAVLSGSRWRRKTTDRAVAIGAAAVAAFVLIVALGIVLAVRTPAGTLLVEVNEKDAVVHVLDEQGNVHFTERCDGKTLSIPIEPGRYRLRVEKDDRRPYSQDFTMEAGDTLEVPARLGPLLPPELERLERYVGSWRHQVVNRPTGVDAERTVTTGYGTWNWTLEGRVIEQFAVWSPAETQGLTLMTYDAENGKYRHWYFASDGSMPRQDLRGDWNEADRSFLWRATDQDGSTREQVHRFLDEDSWEWTLLIRDGAGQAVLDVEGKARRASTLAPLDAREPGAGAVPAEMQVLGKMVGRWRDELVVTVFEGKPIEERTTYTTDIRPILDGRFHLLKAYDTYGELVILTVRGFDYEQQVYRQWVFDSPGAIAESSGQWDRANDTLTMTSEGNGTTGVYAVRLADDDTIEWSLVSNNAQGQTLLEIGGEATRLGD